MKMLGIYGILIVYFILISTGLAQLTADHFSAQDLSVGSLIMKTTALNISYHNETTNVNVTKKVVGTGQQLRFAYDIETPSVDNFYFVLALDSSSSIAVSNEQENAIIAAVPQFINDTIDTYGKYKKFSMSMISWNNKIDFASSPFDNIDPKLARLVPIRDFKSDLAKNRIFGSEKTAKYRIDPTARTDLSVAVKTSMDILNNTNNTRKNWERYYKFIIIVTGESEYAPCSPDLIRAAKTLGYSIYAIEMQPNSEISHDPNSMYQHLRVITGDKDKVPGMSDRTISCQAPTGELPRALKLALNDALKRAISEPVATDVVLSESFYDYIVPDTVSVEIENAPNILTKVNASYRNGTITVTLPYLWAENVTEILLNSNFVLKGLPVSVVDNSKPIIFAPINGSAPSHLQFTWLKTHNVDLLLPECRIDIESNNSIPGPFMQKGNDTTRGGSHSMGNEFGIMTLLSFLFVQSIFRLKR